MNGSGARAAQSSAAFWNVADIVSTSRSMPSRPSGERADESMQTGAIRVRNAWRALCASVLNVVGPGGAVLARTGRLGREVLAHDLLGVGAVEERRHGLAEAPSACVCGVNSQPGGCELEACHLIVRRADDDLGCGGLEIDGDAVVRARRDDEHARACYAELIQSRDGKGAQDFRGLVVCGLHMHQGKFHG